MITTLKIIVAPLLGGVIGYITNDLAIKMLFRPRKAIYIGKFHIPFTPGLIPQQKPRIAASIGRMISVQLLNPETLEQAFLSEEILNAIREKLVQTLQALSEDDRTLRSHVLEIVDEEKLQTVETRVQKEGAALIVERLVSADIGGTIIAQAFAWIKEKKTMGRLAGMLDDNTVHGLQSDLGGKINRMIESKGPEIIEREIRHSEQELMGKQVSELYTEYQEKLTPLVDRILDAYRGIISKNLEKVLRMVNIEQIVVNKIRSFSSEQLEKMIFGIMKRELKAIVYLGAILGFLMGFVNLLL